MSQNVLCISILFPYHLALIKLSRHGKFQLLSYIFSHCSLVCGFFSKPKTKKLPFNNEENRVYIEGELGRIWGEKDEGKIEISILKFEFPSPKKKKSCCSMYENLQFLNKFQRLNNKGHSMLRRGQRDEEIIPPGCEG
ncbi:hypothetical protein R3W88_021321 [Solanum pinnatisectum]|uniref:Uncharacterized protein n=1 Tax=Solanum pinnatisectum TaxID=50273 RepID=A0AAV9LRM5_9SOLN|nr:hypothetical protein R3W88_021321 [Solanum pinnatisectum]